jgi:hypothetical protein
MGQHRLFKLPVGRLLKDLHLLGANDQNFSGALGTCFGRDYRDEL